jgi:5-methylthioribose kinase
VNVLDTPPGYVQFDEERLRRYVAGLPDVRARLGGLASDWAIREVGDGNLNVVFLVNGPEGGVCVKQSLPHIRAVKSWRLPLERTFFEYSYFRIVAPLAPGATPSVYHYEPELFCMVMEQLSPHVVLRRGLVAGRTYPRVAHDVAEYVARACFYTSDLGRPFEAKLDALTIFAKNHALLRITTDLVFNDPYREVERNRWTAPQLDEIAIAFRSDGALKIAAARLGLAFLTNAQALIHGDLHSGSVMVTETDTRVIDPEFALYGPIGFDLGAFVGNLLISYLSQPGHATATESRTVVADWVLAQIPIFWDRFRARFLELWQTDAAGDAFAPQTFADASSRAALLAEQQRYMDGLYADMIGFAAVKMIRRILGFAHVIDFEEISDRDTRARMEGATLQLARSMLTEPERFDTTAKLVAAARAQSTHAHM